ncbi:MAG: hypothetical protein AAFS06_20780 [Cyanobacteria bacterium J06631_12]
MRNAETKFQSTGEILSLVTLFYSNFFIPVIPDDLKKELEQLEQLLKVSNDTPEIEALEQSIIERIADDLKITAKQADAMFSNVYSDY